MDLALGIIGACVGVAGMVFGMVAMFRNKKADDKSDGENDGVVRSDLGYIKKGIEGIERKIEKQENQYIGVIEQLTEVKSSTKQAHKRIDALEEYHKPH